MIASSSRYRLIYLLTAMLVCGMLVPVLAQKGAGGSGSGGAGSGSRGGSGSSNPGSTTTNGTTTPFPTTTTTPSPSNYPPRAIFLSGRVRFDDGTPPNSDIKIERVCGGNQRMEAHTDSKGGFSFQLGQTGEIDTDASDSGTGPFNGQPGNYGHSPFGSTMGRGDSVAALWNCDLQASYPGYRSDSISLAGTRYMDNPDVGTIILHHLGNIKGTTISATTAMAPKHARKDYEKALELEKKGRLDEAEKRLAEATDEYPKYAIAWFELGRLQQKRKDVAGARKSYQAAIAADRMYVSPYDGLALLAAEEGKWEDAANLSKQVISLNSVEFPTSYWYNAVANYNLKKPDDAEKSVKDLLKLDSGHRFPQAEKLMAQLMLNRGDYAGAATHLRAYLALNPNGKDAENLKKQLAKIEQAGAVTKK